MSLGAKIKQQRDALGLTQDQLASRADISKAYLSTIENGKNNNPPSDGVLRALEKALGFESEQLVGIAHLAKTPNDVLVNQERLQAQVKKLRGVLSNLLKNAKPDSGAPVNIDDLANMMTERPNVCEVTAGVLVPIINKVSAGYPHHFTDLDYPPSVADEYIRCPEVSDPQAFAARIVGDSMEPSYHEGNIVIFSPNTQPRNGDDCFVRFEQEGGTTFKRFYQDDEEMIRLQPLNNK